MTNRPEVSVLIAGAGPTGLALACDLARRGVSFRIVDKAAEFFAGSRGKGLQPRSLEVLDDFGVIGEIVSSGRFHLPFRGYEGAKIIGDRDPQEGRVPTPNTPYASTLIIPQWRVEEILRARLAQFGSRVELATELAAFEQNADCVTATLMREGRAETVTAAYLVGADGGRSVVRAELGVQFEGETWASERMLVGEVEVDGLDREHWHSWPNPEVGWVALCPLPGTNSYQFQAQIGPDDPDEPSLARFQQIVDERTGGLGIRLLGATWLSLYRANVRMVDRYRVGRVFLAGDAAHVHSPAGGQGMNTGIQDAYNLGWKLRQVLNGAPSELLDTYEEERLPVAAWMLGVTSKLHRDSLRSDVKDHRPRPEALLQLGINYRGHSLACDQRRSLGSLQAGDRAPDAPCRDAAYQITGIPRRLFDIFRGPHFTILGFGRDCDAVISPLMQRYGKFLRACTIVPSGEPPANEAIVDSEGHAARAYEMENGTLAVVRPDGYIGVAAGIADAGALSDYLECVAPHSAG